MKDSIGEKQAKVFIMKICYLLYDVWIDGRMLALMAIEYQISYNKWINSRSGSQPTKPVQKILFFN